MKEFAIELFGHLKVRANTIEEAERKFWHFVDYGVDLSYNGMWDDKWEIETIEEIKKPKPTAKDWEDFWYNK